MDGLIPCGARGRGVAHCPFYSPQGCVLKYLEAFQQGERGSFPLALSPRRLDGDQLGLGHRGDLLVVDGGEGVEGAAGQAMAGGQGDRHGHRRAGTFLRDEERPDRQAPLCLAPHLPHSFMEDVLHPCKVLACRHFIEETPKPARQRHPFGCRHLPGESGGDGCSIPQGAAPTRKGEQGVQAGSNRPHTPCLLPGEDEGSTRLSPVLGQAGDTVPKGFCLSRNPKVTGCTGPWGIMQLPVLGRLSRDVPGMQGAGCNGIALRSREEMGQVLTVGRGKPPARIRAGSLGRFGNTWGGPATYVTQGPVGPTFSTDPEQHKRPEKHTGDNQSWQREWSENGLQGMGTSRRDQGAGAGSSRAQGQ